MKKKPNIPSVINDRVARVATITKMSKGKTDEASTIEYSNTAAIANSVTKKIATNEDIIQLFPDVKISEQILVSSVLSPNDMITTQTIYDMDAVELPNNLNTVVLEAIKSHVNKVYKLEDELTPMLSEALFSKGAYATAFIPGKDIDTLSSMYLSDSSLSTESACGEMVETSKYLGPDINMELTIESSAGNVNTTNEIAYTSADLDIEVTESMAVLGASVLKTEQTQAPELTTEMMGSVRAKGSSLSAVLHKKVLNNTFTVTVDNTAGTAMKVNLPVNSVIPVHMTNAPSKHVGYFVLLDANGIPVATVSDAEESSGLGDLKDAKASIIKKAADSLKGVTAKDVELSNASELYIKALTANLNSRLSTGELGSLAQVNDDNDIYDVIFRRAVKGLKTRLLYVPKDCMSYTAFEYRSNGTGMSLLEKAAMLFSIRAGNLFTRVLANIKNSVTTTKISAELDPNDPDPDGTSELIMAAAIKSERAKYPFGLINTRDWSEWAQNVGYRFNITDPKLPEISIDISDENRSMAVPDETFDEGIDERIIMSFGLKKDMVMSGYDAERAGTIVANNVMFAKRVMELQKIFNRHLSHYVRCILRNDSVLKEKVMDIIMGEHTQARKFITKMLTKDEAKEYKAELADPKTLAEFVYGEYSNYLEVSVPRVSISVEEGSMEGLDKFVEVLDTYLPLVISADTLPSDLAGELGNRIDDIMSAVKTILIKNWIDDHNLIPELTKFTTLDNTGAPRYDILDEYGTYVDNLAKAVLPHIKAMHKQAESNDKAIDKADGNAEEPVGDTGTPDDNAGETSASDAGGATPDDSTGDTPPDDGSGDGENIDINDL